jgi:hypothetical protein
MPAFHLSGPASSFNMNIEERTIATEPLLDMIQSVLGRGSSIQIMAKGRSMTPFIKDSDTLILLPAPAGSPGLGDVVAFKSTQDNKLAIHRVVKKLHNGYWIKGDSCSEPDGFIPQKDILGVVNRIERAGRRIKFGFGPERFLIAFLSARNILFPFVSYFYKGFYRLPPRAMDSR